MTKRRYCEDCKHVKAQGFEETAPIWCNHPWATRPDEYVIKPVAHIEARLVRTDTTQCGPDARWFKHPENVSGFDDEPA